MARINISIVLPWVVPSFQSWRWCSTNSQQASYMYDKLSHLLSALNVVRSVYKKPQNAVSILKLTSCSYVTKKIPYNSFHGSNHFAFWLHWSSTELVTMVFIKNFDLRMLTPMQMWLCQFVNARHKSQPPQSINVLLVFGCLYAKRCEQYRLQFHFQK